MYKYMLYDDYRGQVDCFNDHDEAVKAAKRHSFQKDREISVYRKEYIVKAMELPAGAEIPAAVISV